MFKTLSIKNITNKYNEKVRRHNYDFTVKKYMQVYGFNNQRSSGSMEEEYSLCFAMKIENNCGEKEKIIFAFKSIDKEKYCKYNYAPDLIIGGTIYDSSVNDAIRLFCSKYGQYLFEGYDIENLVENDEENILNYSPEKKKIKKIKQS